MFYSDCSFLQFSSSILSLFSFLPLPSLVYSLFFLIQLLPGLLSLTSQPLLLSRLPSLPPVPSLLSASQSPSLFPFQALFVSPFSILMPLPPPFFSPSFFSSPLCPFPTPPSLLVFSSTFTHTGSGNETKSKKTETEENTSKGNIQKFKVHSAHQ